MNYNLNLGLKGEYKVDIYSGKKLIETTDWFSNDITNVGLNYPFDYSFARCFMFLSLGGGENLPINNRNEVGLANPILKFKVLTNVDPGNPNSEKEIIEHSGQYIGWDGYEYSVDKGQAVIDVPSTCGTRITERGIRFYRGWTIPTGNSNLGNVLAETLPITQFMVSPSSGSDPKGGGKAFSIVNRPVTIPSGFSATITYQLSIDFENYRTPFTFFSGKAGPNSNGFFDTGDAILSVNGSDETELVRSWSNLSGIFRQIVPGIEAVDSMGACFAPTEMGSELEPSYVNSYNTFFYLSPDISQFAISKSGTYGGEYTSYNSNGLMLNYYEKASIQNISTELHSNKEDGANAYENPIQWFYNGGSVKGAGSNPDTEVKIFKNPRLENFVDISNYKTGKITSDILDYKTSAYTGAKNFPVAFATPGKIGFISSFPDFGQKFVRSSYLKRVPVSEELRSTGTRFKYVTKKAIIPPLYSYGTNSRYGTLTLAHNKSTNDNVINRLNLTPLIDFLFFDSEGRGANMAHYRYIPNIYLKDRGTGVSKIRFDIIGLDGQKPDSINRFYSVYGFMGTGIDNPLTSGLDIGPIGSEEGHFFSHTSLQFTSEDQAKLTPPGPKSIGFLLDGQILNSSVPGDINYNDKTGYGAVYGVIANSGFYFSPYDLCLLDIPNWSGLGGYPYSTGYTGNLCWPHYSKKIYLKLSELEYYDPEIKINKISDPLNYFENKQIIKDILISGSGILPTQYESMVTGGISSEIYLCYTNGIRITGTNQYPTFSNLKFVITGQNFNNDSKYNQISFTPLKKQIGATYAFVFTGFSDNFSLLERGYGSGLNFPTQLSGITGSITISLGNTINNTGFVFSNDIRSKDNFIKNKDYVFVPSNFKKPEAYIYHVETTGNDIGYRLSPNYAIANTGNINKYLPVTGGTFPGLSTENGMELYLTLSWTGA